MGRTFQELLNPSPGMLSAASILEFFLPPQSLIFLGVLLLITPLTLLSAESLIVPLLESVRSVLVPEAVALHVDLPWHFYFKLAVFLVLTFFGFFQLLLRIKLSYYQVWVQQFPRPDSLHLDYQPDPQQSMLSSLSWTLYRWLVLFGPPLGMTTLTLVVGFVELYLFNQLIHLPSATLPAMIILFLFVVMVLGLLSAFALVQSFWNALVSVFGDVIAITEPDLPPNLIMNRCRRIAFTSPWSYLLYPLYCFLTLAIVGQVAWLLIVYDVSDLIAFRVNGGAIFLLSLVTLVFYIFTHYLKLVVYHDALVRYYHQLPRAFRERFAPPPSYGMA